MVLDIRDVHKTFPAARGALRMVMRTAADQPTDALRGVSFDVAAGEVVGLVGPNGAGKTTLFRLIATLLEPTDGSIHVDGFDVARKPSEVRRRIGLLLEGGTGLYRRLTGRENLVFFAVMAGLSTSEARDRADELMEQFELADRDRRVFGYSSGMRLRLALARALISRPPLLLLDEPTRSLDPEASARVVDLIRELAGEGASVLVASHRINEVQAGCDRAVVLDEGRVRFIGTPEGLMDERGLMRSIIDPRSEP